MSKKSPGPSTDPDSSGRTRAAHSPSTETPRQTDDNSRRGFVARLLAVVVGGIVSVFPAAAGLAVFLDPLRSKKRRRQEGSTGKEGYIKVTTLDALLVGGEPRKYSIIDDRSDAWNLYPQEPIGAVYLQRTAVDKVEALNVVCPHAGCFVDFDSGRKLFQCPCHDSSFRPDGSIANERSPSARPMDSLEVDPEKLQVGEVWVKFQNFRSGKSEKIPEA
jgi:menaquinol-cytochrome c reductase iron-sulfur subunit